MNVFVSTYPFGRSDSTPREILNREFGVNVSFNPYTRKLTSEEIAALAIDAEIVIAGTENLDLLISRSNKLKMISRVGIGLDSVDLRACKENGIKVCYTPDAVTLAVVELTIGFMICLTRKIGIADREIRNGFWNRHYGKRLGESTIGIIGFGRIGKQVVNHLLPFRPRILLNDIDIDTTLIETLSSAGLDIKKSSKEEIFETSDIVSLHLPAYGLTHDMINAKILSTFKKEAFLINTARGELINEQHLYEALETGQIAGAALDVFKEEPYEGILARLDNVMLSQHMGSCSFDCRLRMEAQAVEDVLRFKNGLSLLREVPDTEYRYQSI